MQIVTLAFWGLCLCAAALHPLILASYARVFANRKQAIDVLYQSAEARRGKNDESLGGVLRKVYQPESNWRGFFVPVALCAALSATAAAVMMQHSGVATPFNGTLVEGYLLAPNGTAMLGFGGAFLASLYGLIDRFRSLTLSTLVLHYAWFRLLFAAVLGATIANFVSDGLARPTAFALGFLPIRELLDQLTTVARRAFGRSTSSLPQEERSWNLMQGTTPDVIERLEEADVTSISALASQNPIALMHRTNIAWRVLIDLMDQAILFTYVGDKVVPLRGTGVRGAIEAGIVWAREGHLEAGKAPTIAAIASAMGAQEWSVRNLIQNLSEDAQVKLLYQLWFETRDGKHAQSSAQVLFFVPEFGVTPDAIAATMENLRHFGDVATDHITLAPDANVEDVAALLRDARFRVAATSLADEPSQ